MPQSQDAQEMRERVLLRENRFRGFFSSRLKEWMPVVRREMPLNLEELLGPNYRFPVQVPHLRNAGNEHIAILMLNVAKIVTTAFERALDAKQDVEEIETWLTAMMNMVNQGRFLDHWRSEGQVYYGVAVTKRCYEMPKEPLPEDLEPYLAEIEAGEDGHTPAQEEKAREAYYADQIRKTFVIKPVGPSGIMWGPDLNDPAHFVEKSEISYEEFKKLKNGEGFKMGVDKELRHIYLLGHGEHPDFATNNEVGEKTFEFIRENLRDPETGEWWAYEWVKAPDGVDDYQVQKYKVPFEYPEYEITAAGDENKMEQDPHKRYTPMMYALMVSCYELNFLLTIMMELALMQAAGGEQYLDISQANEELITAFTESGFEVLEGRGAAPRQVKIPRNRPTSEGITAYPGQIRLMPSAANEYMLRRIDQLVQKDIPEQMPNRWLTAQVPPTTVASAAGSSMVQMGEAAALPYDKALRQQDESKERDAWAMISFIKTADREVMAEKDAKKNLKKYPIPVGHANIHSKTGSKDMIVITAETLSRHFDISVITKRTTMAEDLERAAQGLGLYRENHITEIELYGNYLGYEDPLEHIKELNLRRHRLATAEQFAVEEANERQKLYEILSGLALPLGVAMDDSAGAPPGGASEAPLPGSVPPSPPQNGGTPPPNPQGGGALGGQLVAPGPGNFPRPRSPMQPPMIPGPEGGTSGFAG